MDQITSLAQVPPARPCSALARAGMRALLALCLALGFAPRAARAQEPAFGDSGWVAPEPAATEAGDPTAPGPRVAPRDHEPTGEMLLRLPFRTAFLPVRLFGIGLDAAAGFLGDHYHPNPEFGLAINNFRVRPTGMLSNSSGPGVGVKVVRLLDKYGTRDLSLEGLWSKKDHRRLRLHQTIGQAAHGQPARRLLFNLEAAYNYRPNYKYYGIGNFSHKSDRSIYLQEEGHVDASLRLGVRADRRVRAFVGYSGESTRRGYNDGPSAFDLFTPGDTPFLGHRSQVVSYGLGGDLAAVDDLRNPTRGAHARAEVREVKGVDDTHIEYRQWHLEARGYLPVFSRRRVLAASLLDRQVDGGNGSPQVPFYRLPESANETRFLAYSSHRFRDRHLVIAQAEYRWEVWNRVWGVALAQLGEVASRADRLRMADVHESYGGGFHVGLSETSTARLEVAKGSEGLAVNLEVGGDF